MARGYDILWLVNPIPAQRHGITLPFAGPLHSQRKRFDEFADLGYTDV